MTTEAQSAANRLNATRSTGPRTPAGKAVVRFNARKHGLLSCECLIWDEVGKDFHEFARRLLADLAPVGALELLLADRIVSTAWRLRRAIELETRLLGTIRQFVPVLKTVLADALVHMGDQNRLQLFSRYEMTIEKSLYRALHELQRLQAVRAGQAVPLPQVTDLEVSVTVRDEPD